MRHPTAAELLELHFGEAPPLRRAGLVRHARSCAACRALLADVAWAEQLLAAAPVEAPPADGLERVMARIGADLPPAARREPGWRPAVPAAAAILAGALAVVFGGAAAAVAFFAAGTLVTLSLAPMLILETQRRGNGSPVR